MLIDFRVTNFRSIRDEAVLSLVASSDTTLEQTHTRPTGLDKIKRVVNTVAIYGANASGKSNVIRALQFMHLMVTTSNQIQPDQENALTPYRMRADCDAFPTLFEATFLIDRTRYQYGFEMNRRQVLSEWLLVYENAKPQVWFSRTFNKKTERFEYSYSDYFVGKKKVWEASTRKEVLFLTTAIQLNNEQLRPLYQHLAEDLVILPNGPSIDFNFSTRYTQDAETRDHVVSLIAAADTGISSVSLKKRQAKQLHVNFGTGVHEMRDAETQVPQFGHAAGGEIYEFEYEEESAGTQILFGLAGLILDILDKGRLLVVDELDRSLHPLLVRKIVAMFNDPGLNPNGAQLVFTTHEVSLLDQQALRRDQIWFAEKDEAQVSHLFSLLQFSPRKGEALEKGYLAGRYGGVPILGTMKD